MTTIADDALRLVNEEVEKRTKAIFAEYEHARERLAQFEAYGFRNVAAVLDEREAHAVRVRQLEAQIKELSDPIVRSLAMAPPSPIIVQGDEVLRGRIKALEEKLEGIDGVLSIVRLAWVVVKNKVPRGWENSVHAVDRGLEALAEAVKP